MKLPEITSESNPNQSLSGLALGFGVVIRIRTPEVVRIVIGMFLSAFFFAASLALCWGGCTLGDALRG
ncbi:MAG: hypothetical protein NTV46_15190 [Verrucomicrobia bacterium]|nr:hypothetical protein [Verrucomicrobiota bacterium]